MPKLIKLSKYHYVAVDDSEIKEVGMFVYDNDYDSPIIYKTCEKFFEIGKEALKITHSFGKELEGVENRALSEAQEIEYGYSLQSKIAKHLEDNHIEASQKRVQVVMSLIQELVKDKLFTFEDIKRAIHFGVSFKDDFVAGNKKVNEIIQSLLPPTEWEVEFINDKMVKI